MCMMGRLPGMIASIVIGNQVFDGQYTSAFVIAACMVVICSFCLVFRHKLIAAFEKFYSRLIK